MHRFTPRKAKSEARLDFAFHLQEKSLAAVDDIAAHEVLERQAQAVHETREREEDGRHHPHEHVELEDGGDILHEADVRREHEHGAEPRRDALAVIKAGRDV